MVEVLALPESVMLGGQLDLVTLAWFPRAVRQQLRTPPTLAPPDVQGVWAYRQASTAGVVASRRIGGVWYDLYASHQIVFPLATGTVAVGRATVSYVQPLSYSFLSRELQHEVQSESLAVHVTPQPAAGRPTAFSGAAGTDLTVDLTASETTLPPGGAATVDLVLAGTGNVALWPEPEVAWPGGLRVYPSGVEIETDLADGRIAGTKRFRFLVLADSAGAHLVPGVGYPYFDTRRARYDVATAGGLRLVAPAGTSAALTRPLPAPPRVRAAPSLADRVARTARWAWLLVLVVPPLTVGLVLARHRIRLPRRRTAGPRDREALALAALDGELRAALMRRLGPSGHQEGAPLSAALRAAGVEASLAQHVARVRDRLQHAVFGPRGVTDPDELAAEVHEVLRALAGEAPGAERRQLVQAGVVLALCVGAATAGAQAPRPEELYAAGAFRAAADSFVTRVTREPHVPAYWYDLGAAYYRLGEDGRARAAWIRAARLAPRDPEIRGALQLLPADPAGRDIVPVVPFRPAEAVLTAAVLWVVGWAAVLRRRLRRAGVALVLAAVVAAFAGWQVAEWYRRPVAIVLADHVPLRVAPYGSADASRPLAAGDAVRIRRYHGPWLLVARPGGLGWVQVGEVARL
jgi:Flp pilus assembly protein TadD